MALASALNQAPPDRVAEKLARVGQEFGHGFALELGRMEAMLRALGSPHEKLPPIVHVAGTNGKGSTCAFVRAIAEQAGLKAHVFTSPHLIRPNERIRLAGHLVSDDHFVDALGRLERTGLDITYFEAIAVSALLLFSETPADVVVLEVGLGGTYDATNVVTPAVSVIAPVDMDHTALLGDRLELIAGEKAGILKPSRPGVIARQRPEAAAVIEARAAAVGATLLECGKEWDCWAANGRMIVQTQDRALDLPMPSLLGAHQVQNAGLAARAALALGDDRYTEEAIGRGIATAEWPARMQFVTKGPLAAPVLAAGGEMWIDGGHNPHAALALNNALAELRQRRARPTIAIVGLLSTKDSGEIFASLAAAVDRVITVPIQSSRSGRDPGELAEEARAKGLRAEAADSLHAAVSRALAFAPDGPRVLICGSLYLAGEALALSGVELT
ncbi:MAG: folylpolyglutamate synthase/dihydrofolate synthase family protein [Hyphomonadaceae bacterium]